MDDESHPLTMGYVQGGLNPGSPGWDFVEKHREEIISEIEKELVLSDQRTRIKLCVTLTRANPQLARDHLISMICNEAMEEASKFRAIQIVYWSFRSEFSSLEQQREFFPHLLAYLEREDNLTNYIAMHLILKMTIPEAAETACAYLNDYFFGEECGLYLAKMGDPAGWPALRDLMISATPFGNADLELATADIRYGLYGLAGWFDLQIEEPDRQEMLAERSAIDVDTGLSVLDSLKAMSRQDRQYFYSYRFETDLLQIYELLENSPSANHYGGVPD
tara:strand:+ start:2091 stop:2921 length:831 start_codon:yes stop_codon:yes gene_type:complete